MTRKWRPCAVGYSAGVRLLPLILSATSVIAPLAWSAEAQVATPFEVRKEAQELFDDLAKRGTAGGDDAALLERTQQLMARHGERLIEVPGAPGAALPLAEALTTRLRELHLFERFVGTYSPLAERKLPASGGTDAELLELTRSYPETPAAATAWKRLADRAWDSGRIGAYLSSAVQAGDGLAADAAASAAPAATAAAGRGRRVNEARTLLTQPMAAPPATVAGLEEMWRIPLDLRATPSKSANRQPRGDQRLPVARIGLSRAVGDLVCGSDGQRAFVIDHLIGQLQAPLVAVGNTALLRRQCVPTVMRDGFAAVGVQDVKGLVLVGIGHDGHELWRTASPAIGFNPLVSAPVAADRIVAVAMVVSDDEAADLRVQGFRQADGKLIWDVLVARLAGHRPWMFSGDQAYALIPSLAVLDGRLLVLSNSGVIARLGTDGDLQRVWTYRKAGADANLLDDNAQGPARMGAIISDGMVAVATPADLPGEVLILRGGAAPVAYRGDGAKGEVLAVGHGMAYLAGARLVGLDLDHRQSRWDAPVPGTGAKGGTNPAAINGAELQATLGRQSLVVAGRDSVVVYDPLNGAVRDSRLLERPLGITAGDQTLVLAADGDGTAYCASWGGTTSVVELLTNAAKADPHDIRSVVALAGIAAARNQTDTALTWYDEAFRRGAGTEYAQQAAVLLRRRLDLAQGAAWDPLLARFAALVARDPSLALEAAWWRARQLEANGSLQAAATIYADIRDRAAPTALLTLRDNLVEQLGTLAACGLARCGDRRALPWNNLPATARDSLRQPWQIAARRGRTSLLSGGLVVGYADGVLTANRISDGGEAWWRKPQRPLLGVRSRNEQPEKGIAVDIMPGTSAAAGGLQTGDILLRFNDQEIRSFTTDLVPAVLALKVRSPFTAEVLRDGKTVNLHGTLGGEMVEPLAINQRTVLVWPTTFGPGIPGGMPPGMLPAGLPGARPEGLWLAAVDLATGTELWRHAVPPATLDDSPARPLLTPTDLVVLADGGDLVALPAHAPSPEVAPVWRLQGQAPLLRDARLMPGGLLWLPDLGHDQGMIIDTASGRLVVRLPMDGSDLPILLDADCFARRDDNVLTCWDLGFGRLRWRAPGFTRLLAARGDTLWAVNTAGQLAALDRFAGTVRRLYGEWNGVLEGRVADEHLYLHVSPAANSHALACLSLVGGAVLWTQPLPADISSLEPTAEGIGCVLAPPRADNPPRAADKAAQNEPAVALAFTTAGDLLRVVTLNGPPGTAQARFLDGGLLIAEPDGLRGVLGTLPADPAPVPSVAADDPENLRWQNVGRARYALAPGTGGRGYDLWVEVTDEPLTIRLGQLGPVVDDGEYRLLFPINPQAVPAVPAAIIPERQSTVEGRLRWKMALPVTLFARGGLPWQIRATSGSDGSTAPWWLRSAWRTIVTPNSSTPGAVQDHGG